MTFLKIIVYMMTSMFVGICKALSLLTVVIIAHICTVSCTKETVLGLQQVDVLSHVQKSEQAIWADEQLHICEEHGLSNF